MDCKKGWQVYSNLPVNTWDLLCSTLSLRGNSTYFLAQQKNFNSPGNQQDAIIPAFWVAFHTAPCHTDKAPTQQQSQEVAERLSSPEKSCLAAVESLVQWPQRQIPEMTKQKTNDVSSSLHQEKKMEIL